MSQDGEEIDRRPVRHNSSDHGYAALRLGPGAKSGA